MCLDNDHRNEDKKYLTSPDNRYNPDRIPKHNKYIAALWRRDMSYFRSPKSSDLCPTFSIALQYAISL